MGDETIYGCVEGYMGRWTDDTRTEADDKQAGFPKPVT